MDDLWKRTVAAVLLSILLPQLAVGIGSRLAARDDAPPTEEPTQSGIKETVFLPQAVLYIPVLGRDGIARVMELEDYIRGVILAEMPASFENDALKAQAVAARTYTLRRLLQGDRHTQGVICTNSKCCQAWISDSDYVNGMGFQKDIEKIRSAVAATAGQVLTYEGVVAESTYYSCSGGSTEDAAAVWGADIPYLQARPSPGEENFSEYKTQVYFTKEEFARALGRNLAGIPESWLGRVRYTAGGGVDTIIIGGITYSGVEVRKLLSLRSTIFTMEADERGITVTTLGNGHRVGMSQNGAQAMALQGKDYRQILDYYYPGTKIDKISELG